MSANAFQLSTLYRVYNPSGFVPLCMNACVHKTSFLRLQDARRIIGAVSHVFTKPALHSPGKSKYPILQAALPLFNRKVALHPQNLKTTLSKCQKQKRKKHPTGQRPARFFAHYRCSKGRCSVVYSVHNTTLSANAVQKLHLCYIFFLHAENNPKSRCKLESSASYREAQGRATLSANA